MTAHDYSTSPAVSACGSTERVGRLISDGSRADGRDGVQRDTPRCDGFSHSAARSGSSSPDAMLDDSASAAAVALAALDGGSALAILDEHASELSLAGGLAAAAHGVSTPPRDLLFDRSQHRYFISLTISFTLIIAHSFSFKLSLQPRWPISAATLARAALFAFGGAPQAALPSASALLSSEQMRSHRPCRSMQCSQRQRSRRRTVPGRRLPMPLPRAPSIGILAGRTLGSGRMQRQHPCSRARQRLAGGCALCSIFSSPSPHRWRAHGGAHVPPT